MRRSNQQLDELIDRLAAGSDSEAGDAVVAFIGQLSSDSVPSDPATENLPRLLAAEAKTVAESIPVRSRSDRVTKPLSRKWRRRAMISAFLSTLLGKLAIATVALAATTGGLAATDNLPDAAQQWVSDAVSNVGINVPAPNDGNLPDAPELPDEASDKADAVVETVFDGDPADGREFGGNIADTASDGASGRADNASDGAGNQAENGADNASDGAGNQAENGADNATDGAGDRSRP